MHARPCTPLLGGRPAARTGASCSLAPAPPLLIAPARYAHFDEGDAATGRKFACALVVGVERPPRRVTKEMSEKKIASRCRVKPFVKVINYSHMMPTRYSFDFDLKASVTSETLKDPAAKKELLAEIRKVLGEKYMGGSSKWFFEKLRF